VRFLLDTNAVVALLKRDPSMMANLRRHSPADVGLSVIVLHELIYGAHRSRRVAENQANVGRLQFETVGFDAEDARVAGEIRARLAAAGTPIGPFDVLLAGQAVARGLAVVTRNTREFDRIKELRVENWEAG
jgi:tRNA(fMet)-specific endonuclease VapC